MSRVEEIKARADRYRTIDEEYNNTQGVTVLYANDFEYMSAEIDRLNAKLKSMNNELCYKCGRYENAHLGSCDGCRWQIERND